MEDLTAGTWISLILAASVGFIAGWVFRDRRKSENGSPADEGLVFKLRERDDDLAAARAEMTMQASTLDLLRNELATKKKKTTPAPDHKKPAKKGSGTSRSRRNGKLRSRGSNPRPKK